MVFGIGLGMTVLWKIRERFFYNENKKRLRIYYEKRAAKAAGIIPAGI
jgi:hypothetical protein